MNTVKCILKHVLYVVYGGVSGFLTPLLLLVSFNFMHGVAHNPDGEILVPFGVFSLLVIFIADIFVVLRTLLSKRKMRAQKVLILTLFLLAKTAGLAMVEDNGLRNFIEYFRLAYMK